MSETIIRAVKQGKKREFSKRIWNAMPPHKWGWKYDTSPVETEQVDLEDSINDVTGSVDDQTSVPTDPVVTSSNEKTSKSFSATPEARKELKEHIKDMTEEQIEKFFEGEDRLTILKLK